MIAATTRTISTRTVTVMTDTYAVVVRADGTVERFDRPVPAGELRAALGVETMAAYTIAAPCWPSGSLTILVNDVAWAMVAAVNPAATALCHPSAVRVLGDVAFIDSDGEPLAREHVAAIVATAAIYAAA